MQIIHICEVKIHKHCINMKSQLSTTYLNRVKVALPPDGMERIAQELNISTSTISRVLAGISEKRQRQVVECALTIIQEENAKIKSLEDRINKVV